MTRAPLHPAVKGDCAVCRGVGYVVAREGERAVASACACIGTCRQCRGSGWVAVGDGPRPRRKRCRCQQLAVRIERFNEANIPGRHAGSTLMTDSFRPYREVMPAFGAVNRYLKGYRRGEENRGLVLYGDVGRGKTHLLVAMLRELVLHHGVTVRFVEFSHLLADIRYGFDRHEGPGELMTQLVNVDVLAIDELGKGRNTEFEGTVLDELVSRRYNAARPILATTNYQPGPSAGIAVGDLATARMPALTDRVGPRVYSRLREICDFCQVQGEDWRERAGSESASERPSRASHPPAGRRRTTAVD